MDCMEVPDLDWRFIPLETVSAPWAMALEETLVEGVATGGPPTVRFWRWDPGAVTLGRFQDVEVEVDLDACSLLGLDVVRRMSGGGTVYHDADREFVYSLTVPEHMFDKGVVGAYEAVLEKVLSGLASLGIEAWVKDDNNVMVGDAKVSGNSQRRSRGVLQVHGTVLWDIDEDAMFSVLRARPGSGTDAGRSTPSKHHPVTGLKELTGVSYEDTYEAIRISLLEGCGYVGTSWSEGELTHAEGLVEAKYGTNEWNLLL